MSQPPEDSAPRSTGPPDRQTLRLLERHLSSGSLIAETAFDPDSYEPRLLQTTLDTERYPEWTTAVRLDIRWFTEKSRRMPRGLTSGRKPTTRYTNHATKAGRLPTSK
jgi:hypothetical protein